MNEFGAEGKMCAPISGQLDKYSGLSGEHHLLLQDIDGSPEAKPRRSSRGACRNWQDRDHQGSGQSPGQTGTEPQLQPHD